MTVWTEMAAEIKKILDGAGFTAMGEYIVQDRPAQWVIDKYGENQIDIYFDSHEAASAFGLKQLNVYLKGEPEK